MKYSRQFLAKLEDLIAETDYILRYERGNFNSGWCVLKENKVIVVNKFFTTDGKVGCLLDILKTLAIDWKKLSTNNRKLYMQIAQTQLPF